MDVPVSATAAPVTVPPADSRPELFKVTVPAFPLTVPVTASAVPSFSRMPAPLSGPTVAIWFMVADAPASSMVPPALPLNTPAISVPV